MSSTKFYKAQSYLPSPCVECREVAICHNVKYVEVSAELDHNVDKLLVGIVKQSRLRQPYQGGQSRSRWAARSIKVKGILDKVWGQDADKVETKQCENLNVI